MLLSEFWRGRGVKSARGLACWGGCVWEDRGGACESHGGVKGLKEVAGYTGLQGVREILIIRVLFLVYKKFNHSFLSSLCLVIGFETLRLSYLHSPRTVLVLCE